MAVSSLMVPLGTPAHDFELPSADGATVRLADLEGPALLVMFLCNHCPYVRHVRAELAAIGREYPPKGISVLAISSNDQERYPEDGPEGMAAAAERDGFSFPYLWDGTQEVAKDYGAACTPDFFLFDSGLRLVYRGQLDDSRPGNGIPVSGRDLRAAMDALLAGEPVPALQHPSIGCSIKWKPGNEPAWA